MVEVSTFSNQLLHFRAISKAKIILWAESGAFDTGKRVLIGAARYAHARPPQGAGAGAPWISVAPGPPPASPASPASSRLTHRWHIRGNSLAEFRTGQEVDHVVHGSADSIRRKNTETAPKWCCCDLLPVDTVSHTL